MQKLFAVLAWVASITAFLAVTGRPAQALVGYVNNTAGKGAILWKDADSWQACQDEQKALGKAGVVCRAGIVALVDNCTKTSNLGGAGNVLVSSMFARVRVLEGPSVGLTGLIALTQWRSEKQGPCTASRSTAGEGK